MIGIKLLTGVVTTDNKISILAWKPLPYNLLWNEVFNEFPVVK